MKYIISESQYKRLLSEDIRETIRLISKEYNKLYGCSLYDINNGYCGDFASEVIDNMGGDSDNLYELSDDMFFAFRDPEYAIENWGEVIETPYGVWSKKMLDIYGYPPVDLDLIDDEISHVWIYYNGKHYDAEVPDGVDNWYDLPIMVKFFDSYKVTPG